jgi:hypothetical protein
MVITGSKQTFRWGASDQARYRAGFRGSGHCSEIRSSKEVADCRSTELILVVDLSQQASIVRRRCSLPMALCTLEVDAAIRSRASEYGRREYVTNLCRSFGRT